ncbi:MAG: DUF6884 domain-containing protein [Promethearchaeota archaeon]
MRQNFKNKSKKKLEIGLVACTKSKRNSPSIPKELYMESDLFRKKRKYCELYHDKWYILSAKYFVLDPDGPVIEPYNYTLKSTKKSVKEEWSLKVYDRLKRMDLLINKLIIHAGKDYYQYLIPLLKENSILYEIPTKHLGIGQQKAWYKKKIGRKSLD